MKVKSQYAIALRAIGQDLADLFPARLEIEVTGKDFVALFQQHGDNHR